MFWGKKSEEDVENTSKETVQNAVVTDRVVRELVPVTEDDGQVAKKILQEVMNAMEYITSIVVNNIDHENCQVNLEITGEDLGKIIGREGATLDALQLLVVLMFAKQEGRRIRITVDANDYRKRKEDSLLESARDTIARVKETGQEIMLEAMSPAERRKVHLMTEDYPEVSTYSTGEGQFRRLVIAPK